MKRLLIVRYPISMHPDAIELSYNKTKERLGDNFLVLPFCENIGKIEVEIVYDPQLVNQATQLTTLCGTFKQEGERQFTQVDTSANAFMEGSIGRRNFERVDTSGLK